MVLFEVLFALAMLAGLLYLKLSDRLRKLLLKSEAVGGTGRLGSEPAGFRGQRGRESQLFTVVVAEVDDCNVNRLEETMNVSNDTDECSSIFSNTCHNNPTTFKTTAGEFPLVDIPVEHVFFREDNFQRWIPKFMFYDERNRVRKDVPQRRRRVADHFECRAIIELLQCMTPASARTQHRRMSQNPLDHGQNAADLLSLGLCKKG